MPLRARSRASKDRAGSLRGPDGDFHDRDGSFRGRARAFHNHETTFRDLDGPPRLATRLLETAPEAPKSRHAALISRQAQATAETRRLTIETRLFTAALAWSKPKALASAARDKSPRDLRRDPLRGVCNVGLPESQDAPARLPEHLRVLPISGNIGLELRDPVRRVVAMGQLGEALPEMAAVPEVAIAEDRDVLFREDDVGAAGELESSVRKRRPSSRSALRKASSHRVSAFLLAPRAAFVARADAGRSPLKLGARGRALRDGGLDARPRPIAFACSRVGRMAPCEPSVLLGH